MFKNNQPVVKLLTIMGIETATVTKIVRAKKDRVQCDGDEHLWYSRNDGSEIDPAIPNCSSRLVELCE